MGCPATLLTVGMVGDFDNDGDVNGRDFLAWQRNPELGASPIGRMRMAINRRLLKQSRRYPSPVLRCSCWGLCFCQGELKNSAQLLWLATMRLELKTEVTDLRHRIVLPRFFSRQGFIGMKLSHAHFFFPSSSPVSSTARNAFWGMSTEPIDFIRFLPSFCFSHSLRLRVMSPP